MKDLLENLYKYLGYGELVKTVEYCPPVPPVPIPPKTNSEKLYEFALTFLGKDASPKDAAPDEYGCMESVDTIYKGCFGEYIGGKLSISTYETYGVLVASEEFVQPENPREGDIVISPTGYGNGSIVGHVGILGKSNIIMSNNSSNGKWEENFTTTTWRARYVEKGKLPMRYFRKIN